MEKTWTLHTSNATEFHLQTQHRDFSDGAGKKWNEIFSTELGYAEYFEKCKATKKRKNPMTEVKNDITKAVEKINSLNTNAEEMMK